MGFRPPLFIFALSLNFPHIAYSQAVPADVQIVVGHSPLNHPASSPPLSFPSTDTAMSASSGPAPDDDFDPFLAPAEGDPKESTAWNPTISVMRRTNHRKWGFLVYRVYYGDDAAWQRFMDILNRATDNLVREMAKPYILPFLNWTEMQDRTTFDGASKDDIREHFQTWVRSRSVERDGPGVEGNEILMRSPRYQACLYVDKEAMESGSITEHPFPLNPTGVYLDVKGRLVLLDSQLRDEWWPQLEVTQKDLDEMEEEGWEEEQYSPVESDTGFDVGWMYIELMFASVAYDTMCENIDTWSQPWFYRRPPLVWDGSFR